MVIQTRRNYGSKSLRSWSKCRYATFQEWHSTQCLTGINPGKPQHPSQAASKHQALSTFPASRRRPWANGMASKASAIQGRNQFQEHKKVRKGVISSNLNLEHPETRIQFVSWLSTWGGGVLQLGIRDSGLKALSCRKPLVALSP